MFSVPSAGPRHWGATLSWQRLQVSCWGHVPCFGVPRWAGRGGPGFICLPHLLFLPLTLLELIQAKLCSTAELSCVQRRRDSQLIFNSCVTLLVSLKSPGSPLPFFSLQACGAAGFRPPLFSLPIVQSCLGGLWRRVASFSCPCPRSHWTVVSRQPNTWAVPGCVLSTHAHGSPVRLDSLTWLSLLSILQLRQWRGRAVCPGPSAGKGRSRACAHRPGLLPLLMGHQHLLSICCVLSHFPPCLPSTSFFFSPLSPTSIHLLKYTQ
jgi:hypothetical protein